MKKAKRRSKPLPFSDTSAVKQFKAGKTVSQIAQSFGYAIGDGENRVRRALRAAGLYQNGRKQAAPTPAAPVAKKQTNRKPAPAPALGTVPDDPETALKVCLRTIDVNASKLNLDEAARGKFARMLMGMIATNFGVTDFQVRRPVLVLDQTRAMAHMAQVAQA